MPERVLVHIALLFAGLLLAVPTAAACNGLSPGDELIADGSRCTLAFLFADVTGLYFATAGHCLGEGSRASSPGHGEWGTAVLSFDQDGAGRDFALIRVDENKHDALNPALCTWGGPTGIYDTTPASGEVRHHGWGLLVGDLGPTRARSGANLWWDGGSAFTFIGAGVPGDSGSAVISADGRAIGVLTHVGIFPATAATNGGTHLVRGFELAREQGLELRLVLEGEDPVAVLETMRGERVTAVTPPEGGPDGNASAPEEPAEDPEPSGSGEPADGSAMEGAVVQEPLDRHAADDEKANVPAPGLALGVLALLLAARRRRV